MAMTLPDLALELKNSLGDSGNVFRAPDDGDFKRFLVAALPDMQFKRPLTGTDVIALQEGQTRYAMPATDYAAWKTHDWGNGRVPSLRPWEASNPGSVPRVEVVDDGASWWVVLDSAPTALQLAAWGRSMRIWYFRRHTLADDAAQTTVNVLDRNLLLLRAQAEALLELARRNYTKPVQMRDGYSGMIPRNATPMAIHDALMKLFREAR